MNLEEVLSDLTIRWSTRWSTSGLPAYGQLMDVAGELERIRKTMGLPGLWNVPPLMVTATLDDGIGQGLRIIERFAGLAGLRVHPIGLTVARERIVAECWLRRPALLGVTVLQIDSEEDLRWIGESLPEGTRLVAGGAAFRTDPDLAGRCGVDFVAGDVAAFISYLLQTARKSFD
ncbi:MAG: cobalamin B12-binding domain-containing protein [Desulfobacterales bacterium]|nr:cobalamin B12-binding domain-containing protein [Desulfobacterales bacterium]